MECGANLRAGLCQDQDQGSKATNAAAIARQLLARDHRTTGLLSPALSGLPSRAAVSFAARDP